MPPFRSLQAWSSHAMKCVAIAILSIPAIGTIISGSSATTEENRQLAAWPAFPASAAEAVAAPAAVTRFIDDRFGYRAGMIKLNNRLRYKLFREFPGHQLVRGRHGRFFLAAHTAASPPYLAIANVCGHLAKAAPDTIDYYNRMFAEFHALGLRPHLLIVPSSPVVHWEDAPRMVAGDCALSETPVTEVLESPRLGADARANIYFPLAEMRRIKDTATLFPRSWFHWSGAGLDDVARLSLARFFGMEVYPAPPLKTQTAMSPSDVAHLATGLNLPSELTVPDLPASGVEGCWGSHCFPEMGDAGKAVGEMTRFKNPAAPARRLVILSDSFGAKISPWYARYYRDVAQISTNNVGGIAPRQVQAIKDVLLNDQANTDLLLLYHDGSAVHTGLKLGVQRLHAAAP